MKNIFAWAFICLAFCWHSPAAADHTASLLDLVNGATLSEGNNQFSNFQLLADDGTYSPDLSLITVTAIADGLEFSSNSELRVDGGFETLAFQVGFDAMSSAGGFRFVGSDLQFGNAMAGDTGLVDLFSEFTDLNGNTLETNAFLDPFTGESELTSLEQFTNPATQLSSIASFTLFGEPNSVVSADSFRVTFSAVPEPTSVLVLSVAMGFIATRRRR